MTLLGLTLLKRDFVEAINDYQQRERRYGKTSAQLVTGKHLIFLFIMIQRTYTTFGLWLGIIAFLWFGGTAAGVWLLAIVAFLTQWEFYLLLQNMGYKPYIGASLASGAVVVLGSYYLSSFGGAPNLDVGTDLLALIVILLSLSIVGKNGFNRKMGSLVPSIFGLIYIPFMLHFFVRTALILINNLIHHVRAYSWWFGLFLVAKFTDVGGLLVGKQLGKNKMAPNISPGKTWEGTAGGIVLSAVVGTIFVKLFDDGMPANFTMIKAFFVCDSLGLFGGGLGLGGICD